MKRILVTGSNGLLGQKITDLALLDPEIDLVASSKGSNRYPITSGYRYVDLDVCDANQLLTTITKIKPDTIIHTAAMTNVDACEDDRETCRKLNVDAVKSLATICKAQDIHLIHLSTDFIFDGASGPYTEDDEPNPLSYYGQSKLDAEQLIHRSCA